MFSSTYAFFPSILGRVLGLCLGLGLIFGAIAPSSSVFAQTKSAKTKKSPKKRSKKASKEASAPKATLTDLKAITAQLKSANADEVRDAIDLLVIIDRPPVVPPLADLLRAGQPDHITDRALTALESLAQRSSVPVLTEFTNHRRTVARQKSYKALAAVGSKEVPPLLVRGLSDSDSGVRSICAVALGQLGAKDSIDPLFRAFERGVTDASASIGTLGKAETVKRFSTYLGQRPLSVMLSGFEKYLGRRDIPLASKKAIVTQLGEVATPAVRDFLAEYLDTFGKKDKSDLKKLVDETMRRIREESTKPGAAS